MFTNKVTTFLSMFCPNTKVQISTQYRFLLAWMVSLNSVVHLGEVPLTLTYLKILFCFARIVFCFSFNILMMSLHSLPSCMVFAEKYAATNPNSSFVFHQPKWHGARSNVGPLATAPPDRWHHGERSCVRQITPQDRKPENWEKPSKGLLLVSPPEALMSSNIATLRTRQTHCIQNTELQSPVYTTVL